MTLLVCLALLAQQGETPTGYEDYLKAAQVVVAATDIKPPEEGDIAKWADDVLKRYGRACDWVREGNKKGIAPLNRREAEADFPEFEQFRKIGYLFQAEIFQRIGDGKPNQAADSLIDALTFGRNIQTTCAIGYNLGSEIIERALIMFDKNRRAFAEKGLENIAKSSRQLLENVPALRLAMLTEIAVYRDSEEMVAMDGARRSAILLRCAEIEVEWQKMFASEERAWKPSRSPEQIDEHLSALEISLQIYWKRAIMIRTKLRLVEVISRVLLHEMRTFALPNALVEAAGEQASYDPATGSSFFYGKRDDAFVIYSDGIKEMGRIELGVRYQDPEMIR